jgi:hypothetical protein
MCAGLALEPAFGVSPAVQRRETKECAMRSLIISGLVTASLAFGNSAMAANVHAKPVARAPASHTNVAARYSYPTGAYPTGSYSFGQPYNSGQPYAFGRPQVNPQQIISSLLSSPFVAPYLAQYGGRIRVTRGSSGGTDVPYDYSTPDSSPPPDTSIQDMLNNQSAQQTSDEINDINEMNASNAAAAEQNAADSAAMTQQIMNNGGL